MGNIYIPIKALLQELGYEVIVPPPCTEETLNIGVALAPETACLPLKVTVGNFIEAQRLGAEVAIMAGGVGPCRFGFYGQVQREILRDLNIDLDVIILEPPQGDWNRFWRQVQLVRRDQPWSAVARALRISWHKFQALDVLETAARQARPVAANPRQVDAALSRALQRLDQAQTVAKVKEAVALGVDRITGLKVPGRKPRLRIALVGEIYTLLEPFVNLDVEKLLGRHRVLVEKKVQIGDWVKHHLLLAPLQPRQQNQMARIAKGYLSGPVGGHGLESVAHALEFARQGVDGILHLLPFTCMPEIVAQSALAQVSRISVFPL